MVWRVSGDAHGPNQAVETLLFYTGSEVVFTKQQPQTHMFRSIKLPRVRSIDGGISTASDVVRFCYPHDAYSRNVAVSVSKEGGD